jgi:hypothetical protein
LSKEKSNLETQLSEIKAANNKIDQDLKALQKQKEQIEKELNQAKLIRIELEEEKEHLQREQDLKKELEKEYEKLQKRLATYDQERQKFISSKEKDFEEQTKKIKDELDLERSQRAALAEKLHVTQEEKQNLEITTGRKQQTDQEKGYKEIIQQYP